MVHRLRLVVLHDGSPLPDAARIEELADVRYTTEDELVQSLPGADTLFLGSASFTAVPAAWAMNRALAPSWLHVAATGVENVLATRLVCGPGVTLTNSQGIYEPADRWAYRLRGGDQVKWKVSSLAQLATVGEILQAGSSRRTRWPRSRELSR
jgi:hypothetical protein